MNNLLKKASIVLTPTAYSDGSLNTVIPPYQVLSELVTNGNFDDGLNGWSSHNGSTLELEDGKAKVTTVSGQGYIKRTDLSIQSGKTYFCKADITNATNPVFFINGFSNFLSPLPLISGNTYGGYITTTGNNPSLYIRGNNTNGQVSFIDNVSVKEVQEADFDFSRGSSATRVNEQGLVEDVQILSGELVQNGNFEQIGSELVTNGNFDTDSDWIKGTGWSISGGVAIANNVPNLQRLQGSGDASVIGNIYKYSISVSNVSGAYSLYIYGVYVLTSVSTEGIIEGYVTATSTNGVVFIAGATTDGLISATIDNVSVKEVGQNWSFGTGWSMGDGKVIADGTMTASDTLNQSYNFTDGNKYRFKFTVSDYQSGSVYIREPFNGGADAVSANGTFTFDYIAGSANEIRFRSDNGFIGSLDNVSYKEVTDDTDLPRIDFTDGTGSLLLEPQRTNSIPYSEDYTQWTVQSGTTITSNTTETLSPSGEYNASKIVGNGSNGFYVQAAVTGVVSRSIYLKSVTGTVNVVIKDPSLTVTTKTLSVTENWQRFELVENNGHASMSGLWIDDIPSSGIYAWGAQLESGDYLTSYIPTSGSTVTRSQDIMPFDANPRKIPTGNQAVLYLEIATNETTNRTFGGFVESTTAMYGLYHWANLDNNKFGFNSWNGDCYGFIDADFLLDGNFHKIAALFDFTDFTQNKLFIDGTQYSLSQVRNTTTQRSASALAIDAPTTNQRPIASYKTVALFDEALTDSELACLTSQS